MVGEACLPSNAYYPRTPDYTLCSGVHVCWSEHSDSSFVYGFMILDYGFGTMTATTFKCSSIVNLWCFVRGHYQIRGCPNINLRTVNRISFFRCWNVLLIKTIISTCFDTMVGFMNLAIVLEQ